MQPLAQVRVVARRKAGIEFPRQCVEFPREQEAQCRDRIRAAETRS